MQRIHCLHHACHVRPGALQRRSGGVQRGAGRLERLARHRGCAGSWRRRGARRREAVHAVPAGHAVGEGALMCALCGAR